MLKTAEKFVVFSLNQKSYAISIFDSYQIFAIQNISPVPQISSLVAGLTYQAGHIVTVLNTAKILGIKEKIHCQQAVLLSQDNHYYAYLVDQILEIVDRNFIQKNKIKILQLEEILKTLNSHE